MFTGLNEIHFPAQLWAEPNVNTEDMDGKQTMENMSWRALLPRSREHPSMALAWHTYTHVFLCCEHTITIHHRVTHTPSFWAGWVRILSLASLHTWGELLFASGNLDNLNAACSGLSKTTVSFPQRTSTHTPAARKQLLFHHPFLACAN